MKKINEQTNKIFNEMYINSNQSEFLDLRNIENKSNVKAKEYKNKNTTTKIIQPDYYRFKLVIWFKNRDKNLWIPSIDFYKGPNGKGDDFNTLLRYKIDAWTDDLALEELIRYLKQLPVSLNPSCLCNSTTQQERLSDDEILDEMED